MMMVEIDRLNRDVDMSSMCACGVIVVIVSATATAEESAVDGLKRKMPGLKELTISINEF